MHAIEWASRFASHILNARCDVSWLHESTANCGLATHSLVHLLCAQIDIGPHSNTAIFHHSQSRLPSDTSAMFLILFASMSPSFCIGGACTNEHPAHPTRLHTHTHTHTHTTTTQTHKHTRAYACTIFAKYNINFALTVLSFFFWIQRYRSAPNPSLAAIQSRAQKRRWRMSRTVPNN